MCTHIPFAYDATYARRVTRSGGTAYTTDDFTKPHRPEKVLYDGRMVYLPKISLGDSLEFTKLDQGERAKEVEEEGFKELSVGIDTMMVDMATFSNSGIFGTNPPQSFLGSSSSNSGQSIIQARVNNL